VFISRRSHSEIIALYEARLKEAEKREAYLEGELVFYPNAWLERLGLKPPIPKPAEVTAVTPSAPITVPSELEQRKTFQLDKSEWTVDDRQFFEDYWLRPNVKKGMPPEEVEYHYYQAHGNHLPMTVFLDSAFPIQ
jgi:hypothetical protein